MVRSPAPGDVPVNTVMFSESFQIAAFRAGAYTVTSGLSPVDHAIAAVHEDLHGITRRSSAFGAILRVAEALLDGSSDERDYGFLQTLASRGRTSEEVFATYGALLDAHATSPHLAAQAETALRANVGYQTYADIGRELVGTDPPAIASVILDAIVRFCWSGRDLPSVSATAGDPSVLTRTLPAAFPDRRLSAFRRAWSKRALDDCVRLIPGSAARLMAQPMPTARELFGVPDNVLFMLPADSAAEVTKLQVQVSTARAQAQELSVHRIYERLVAMFADTPLAAKTAAEINDYFIAARDFLAGVVKTAYEFPERLQLRPERRPVRSVDSAEPRSTVLFVRRRIDFEAQLQLVDSPLPESEIVAYRGWADSLQGSTTDPLRIKLVEVAPDSLALVNTAPPASRLVGVWASAYLRWPDRFLALMDGRASVWLICDVQPRDLIKRTRPLIPELRAQWLAGRDRPSVGILAVPQVGLAGPLDGIVFPGSAVVCNGQLPMMLSDVLGDDLRGVGRTVLISEEGIRRHREAEFLSRWLVETECTFSFLGEAP